MKQLRQESKNSDELIFQRFFKYDTNDKNVVKILNWDPSEKKYQKFQNSHLTWTQESTIDNGK
ncbi:hypothetical protein IJM86_02690 [bacterium]|nr:hypothetical protein [bacterium]